VGFYYSVCLMKRMCISVLLLIDPVEREEGVWWLVLVGFRVIVVLFSTYVLGFLNP
jgi:hypothetical protein